MKQHQLSTDHRHREHLEWLSKLDFYREELAIFQSGLQQVVQEHPELLSIIEHVDEYRAILLRKKILLEQFSQRIREQEQWLMSGENFEIAEEAHLALASELGAFFEELENLKPTFRRFVAYND